MLRRLPLPVLLRLALLVLLALGSCLQPVLAAACDIEDARIALEAGSTRAVLSAADAGHTGDDDRCGNPACGDCCLHAAVTLPTVLRTLAFEQASIVLTPLRCIDIMSTYPVDSRPPIVG